MILTGVAGNNAVFGQVDALAMEFFSAIVAYQGEFPRQALPSGHLDPDDTKCPLNYPASKRGLTVEKDKAKISCIGPTTKLPHST